jgi:hypothetical protein
MTLRTFLSSTSAVARMAAIGWTLLSAPLARAQEGQPAEEKPAARAEQQKESAERLANMRHRAEGTHIFVVKDDDREEIEMRAEPVFRYADQPREIVDGTLWVWGEPGRPAALQKVEYFPPTPTNWTYCLASLSPGLVGAEWRGGRQWTATKPGVVLRQWDDGPEPSASKPGRLRQMKDVARRFAVRASEGTHRDEQLRLMPQPIHRYADAEQGLQDGAIFGFGSGTNPNCLLLVELRSDEESSPAWHYGFVGMSAESLRARLDEKEVWFFPAAGKIGAIDSWIWFFEAPGMED